MSVDTNTPIVHGPMWSRSGLDLVSGRYPLRVERWVSRMVGGLLPGVITVTPHARYYALHGLVWDEVEANGLSYDEGLDLVRRCEVVMAGVFLTHEHAIQLGMAHGADAISDFLSNANALDVDALSRPGAYANGMGGFWDAYNGSERLLGILAPGQPPTPGPRFDRAAARSGLGDVIGLARKDTLPLAMLQHHGHLCICQAVEAADGEWLRQVFTTPAPLDGFESADQARRDTSRLIGRVAALMPTGSMQEAFKTALAWGEFVDEDDVARSIRAAYVWRGIILRNYSVGAWRRIWSWLVDQLGEPKTPDDLADEFAAGLPETSLKSFVDALPPTSSGGVLLPAEHELRRDEPDPVLDLGTVMIGAQRIDELEGETLKAFEGRSEPLSPKWLRERLQDALVGSSSLRAFGRDLVLRLVERADRVALTKMRIRADGTLWMASRIRERDGLLVRLSREGWGDVALRVDTYAEILRGLGLLDFESGQWSLTERGQASIG